MIEELRTYFENTKGFGVLSTADAQGQVDAAVYSRPHFVEDDLIAFIMRDRLTHHNLQSNPHAAFLFRESGNGYKGRRLFLTKVDEEKETDRLYELRRRTYPQDKERRENKFLVFFRLDQQLPLVGADESAL